MKNKNNRHGMDVDFKQITIPERKGWAVQCQCGYAWTYCGKNERYASCPSCRSIVTLQPKRNKPHNWQEVKKV
jgi:hypothetical protein